MSSKRSTLSLVSSSVALLSSPVFAGDIEFKKSVKTTGYAYETTLNDETESDQYAAVIEPEITAIFTSKKLNGALNAKRTQVFQEDETSSLNSIDRESGGFTSLDLRSNLSIIDQVLSLSLNGNQTYRSGQQGNGLLSDPVAFSGELSKIQNYTSTLSFVTPNPQWLGATAEATISETKADESSTVSSSLNSENTALIASVFSGRKFERVNFQLSGQIINTQREASRDFDSHAINSSVEFGLIKDISWTISGAVVEYDFGQGQGSVNRRLIDTTSFGSGLRWRPSQGRAIEISYNQLEEDDNKTKYVGANISWAFSPRTALFIDYGKRFYGDAIQASFNYNLRHFRSSFSYTESVTSFSRLNLTFGEPQLFVCEIGTSDLASCFQPQTQDYELQPGEEFRAGSTIEGDLVDEVFIGKSANWSFGYDKGRLKTSLNLRYFETEFLESDREQENGTASFSALYQIGKRTDFGLDINYSKRQLLQNEQDTITKSAEISLDKKISNRTKVDLGFRLVDRVSGLNNSDILDKRITLGISYSFK